MNEFEKNIISKCKLLSIDKKQVFAPWRAFIIKNNKCQKCKGKLYLIQGIKFKQGNSSMVIACRKSYYCNNMYEQFGNYRNLDTLRDDVILDMLNEFHENIRLQGERSL